jgi:hypothetical protein
MNDPHRIPSTSDDIIELYKLCIKHHGKDKEECKTIEKLYIDYLKKDKESTVDLLCITQYGTR